MYLASSVSFSKTCENETSHPYKVFDIICIRAWMMVLYENVAESGVESRMPILRNFDIYKK